MEDYEISSATLAIVPLGEEISKVYEEEDEYIIQKSANSIIKDNCEFYGSSYEGRCIGTKALTGIKTKYPIIRILNKCDISKLYREGNDNPFQYSCLENPMDGGA